MRLSFDARVGRVATRFFGKGGKRIQRIFDDKPLARALVARDIAAEVVADTTEVRALVRRLFGEEGELVSEVVPAKAQEPTKFEQYYAFREKVKPIPSHRFLAIRRGEAEGFLRELEESLKKGGSRHSPSGESWTDRLKNFFS